MSGLMTAGSDTHDEKYQVLIRNSPSPANMDNDAKRVLHSELELLRMSIEEDTDFSTSVEGVALLDSMTKYSNELKLDYAKRDRRGLVAKLDELLRMLGVWLLFITFACFLSLPVILFGVMERRLAQMGVHTRDQHIAPIIQRFMARLVLIVSGIHMTIQGLSGGSDEGGDKFAVEPGSGGRLLVCFTHASSLDAFIICATCPVPYTVLAKKELFLIPFFSWLLVAIGGVPINKNNRAEAVRSMNHAARATREGDCVLVSPEGTRSLSGQLIGFKKGPFYLWESMEAKIVPLVIFGAYDLFPPGQFMANTGRIYVRFLTPVLHKEARTRQQMSNLVRRRMLEALKDCPKDCASDVSLWTRVLAYAVLCAVVLLDSYIFQWLQHLFVQAGLSPMDLTFLLIFGSVAITLIMYVYAVYIGPSVKDITGCSSAAGCCTTSFESASSPNSSAIELVSSPLAKDDGSREPMLREQDSV